MKSGNAIIDGSIVGHTTDNDLINLSSGEVKIIVSQN